MLKPNLPIYQFKDKSMMLLQNVWKAAIAPAISSPLIQGSQVNDVSLTTNPTTFNHLLSRQMVGWFVVDQNASAMIYRSKPLNDQTLTLTASAPVVVSIWCY